MMSYTMKRMVRSLSPEERERMLLEMMPSMMKNVKIDRLLPNLFKEMGPQLNLLNAARLVDRVSRSDKIRATLTSARERVPEQASTIMPVMMPLMKRSMPTVMPMMMAMMEHMRTSGECPMLEMVEDHPEMAGAMGETMMEMCPKMASRVIPVEKREEFLETLASNLDIQSVIYET
jgi:hypothetical protein